MAKMIESNIVTADYDMPCQTMIVELTDGRRVWLTQSFGGMSTLAGGCCRWQHGAAILLLPTDTMQTVETMQGWSGGDSASDWDCLLNNGKDSNGRKLLDWDGSVIDRVARSTNIVTMCNYLS